MYLLYASKEVLNLRINFVIVIVIVTRYYIFKQIRMIFNKKYNEIMDNILKHDGRR